jgi:ribonuclease P protein component
VVRNRIKRRVREWFRSARPRIAPGADVVVIARHGAGGIDTRTTWRALDELLRSAERGAP